MKRFIFPIISLFGLMAFLCIACKSPAKKPTKEKDVQSEENVGFDIPPVHLLTDSLLPQYVDYKQDISHLSYEELRILRSYPYALHGYWFMEADLNSFFINKTDWYFKLCDTLYYEYEYAVNSRPYADTYDKVKLTPTEKAFIERIDRRMEELATQKYVTVDGYKLLNPSLCINLFQIYRPEPKFMEMLSLYNFVIAPTDYEQLFNVYESNDYHQMPNFITTDLYLQAFHMYFSYVLKSLEKNHFTPTLRRVLHALYTESLNLSRQKAIQDEAEYTATFFAIAYQLLTGSHLPVPHAYQEAYKDELRHIAACEDGSSAFLGYTDIIFPYSLFKPRGHYNRDESTQRYFCTMMWLQSAAFCREKTEALWRTIIMAAAFNRMADNTRKACLGMYDALTFLMGEPDNASIIEIADFLDKHNLTASVAEKDENVAAHVNSLLTEVFKTRNRITPKIQLSCNEKINFMPQRYMADNEILGTMADATPGSNRAYPKGLDVFAAFGVESAAALLDTCYHEDKNWKDFRKTADKMKEKFNQKVDWNRTMYDKWIESLIVLQRPGKNYPGFMCTPAWKCKNLQTALASWSELKHDALLYGEHPLAAECGGAGLPNPIVVGYVEPNLPFWRKLKELLVLNRKILEKTGFADQDLMEKTSTLEEKVDFCIHTAEKELRRETLTEEEYETIRVMGSSIEWFTLSVIEPGEPYDSWNHLKGTERSVALVSDVYTRNISGCPKNGILYEATGNANAIYVLLDIGGQTYITCGAIFGYYEFTRPLGDRLTDEAWQQMLKEGKTPPAPEWIRPYFLDRQPEANEWIFYSTGC